METDTHSLSSSDESEPHEGLLYHLLIRQQYEAAFRLRVLFTSTPGRQESEKQNLYYPPTQLLR